MFVLFIQVYFLGSEYFLSIEPVVVEGEEDLLNVAHEKRSCFFQESIWRTTLLLTNWSIQLVFSFCCLVKLIVIKVFQNLIDRSQSPPKKKCDKIFAALNWWLIMKGQPHFGLQKIELKHTLIVIWKMCKWCHKPSLSKIRSICPVQLMTSLMVDSKF